jgi:mannose-6-phosphate isomerase
MPLPPIRFEPILRARAWGGRRLSAFGKALPPAPATIGESWEITDLGPPVEDGVSRVIGGPFAGQTVSAMLERHGRAMLGASAVPGGRFPWLVKYLDAAEHLSVQVHPTARYAANHPGAHLKTEAWVVLDATPGAAVFRGIRPDVTPDRFRAAVDAGTAVDLLVRVPVTAGDCVPLESGLCHALGAGVLVAEVQTPSDTTFRVYDWNRNDPARPLHLDQAMECILFGPDQHLEDAPVTSLDRLAAAWSDGLRAATLCRTAFFAIEAIEASPSGDAGPLEFGPTDGPEVLMLGRGEAIMQSEGHARQHLHAGDTVLLPAERVPTVFDLSPGALLLRASMPDAGQDHRDGPRAGEHLA